MKRLWKVVPPYLSDVMGLQAVVNETEGFGIIDDPAPYKPIGFGRNGGAGGHGHGHGRPDGFGRGGADGRHGGGRPGGRGKGMFPGMRVMQSEISNADIITGTESKVRAALDAGREQFHPEFMLLCHAPSSSMIGSDLETMAAEHTARSGVPTAYVNADGSGDYVSGAGATLAAMGRLLLTPQDMVPGTVNLLGCTTIDWTADALTAAEAWLADAGFQVCSRWGMKDTTARLRGGAAASVNLVVGAAGLPLARYMQTEFGIPYVAGAPFGAAQCAALLEGLRGGVATAKAETGTPEGAAEALVLGEQFLANAMRAALEARGWKNVRVASFYEMDKAQMRPGDRKLTGEDDLSALLAEEPLHLVLGDPDCRPLAKREVQWIDLPNPGSMSPFEFVPARSFVGAALDAFLDEAIGKGGAN